MPRPPIDITGERYGRWTVLKRGEPDERGRTQWWCRCDCGNEKLIKTMRLRKGESRSCGCLAADVQRGRITQYAYPVKTGATKYVVEKDGKSMTLREWSKELDINLSTLVLRWNRGWSDDEILKPTVSRMRDKFKMPDPQWELDDNEKEGSPPPR